MARALILFPNPHAIECRVEELARAKNVGLPMTASYGSGVSGHLKEVVRLGWGGAKANLRPGAVLWVAGLALVISYYQVAAVAEVLDRLGEFKRAHSPWFGMISTALFASLIPWVVQAVFRTGSFGFRPFP